MPGMPSERMLITSLGANPRKLIPGSIQLHPSFGSHVAVEWEEIEGGTPYSRSATAPLAAVAAALQVKEYVDA